jgi:hypothetical protein
MIVSTINQDALLQAATFLVGPQATNAIVGLYQLIDRLQKEAYDLGVNVGETNVDQREADAWDLGYDQGEEDGMQMADDAYVQGVADARARPETADEKVAMIAEKSLLDAVEEDYFSEYDEANVQDSGDENCGMDEDDPDFCGLCNGRCTYCV